MKTKHLKNLLALIALIAAPVAVFGSSSSDRQIEEAARSSYNFRTVLDDRVKVEARDGVVTLTGTVQDMDEKKLAADTVENLSGVTSVNNEITVKSSYPEHSDAWIALKVRSQLLVKANVSVANTRVSVSNGVVTLTGTAKNTAQKELTGVYAGEIDGVKSVQNEIAVKDQSMASNDAPTTGNISDKVDDASITSQVKYALLTHKATSALKTKVTTTNGVVYISGEAGSEAEKSLVTKLAQDVRGATSVQNDMSVRS